MTEVKIKKENNRFVSVGSKGHADFAGYGEDIVCAAVSILMINTVNSIKALTDDEIEVKAEQEKGILQIILPKEYSEQTKVLLMSLEMGLSGIASEYPENIKLDTEEVLK